VKRSSKWPALRRKFLKINKACAVCGKTKKLEVHHIRPYHLYPALELEMSNLITLCEGSNMNCHLVFGHRSSYKDFNLNIVLHAKIINGILCQKS
jgi:hypothetical protein